MKTNYVTYGPGGYDPGKPNNNIVSEGVVDMPDPAPTVSMKDLRAQLAAAGTIVATKAVLATMLNVMDPDHPLQAAS